MAERFPCTTCNPEQEEDADHSVHRLARATPSAQPAGGRVGSRVDSAPDPAGIISMTCVEKAVKFGLSERSRKRTPRNKAACRLPATG